MKQTTFRKNINFDEHPKFWESEILGIFICRMLIVC